MLDTQLSQQLKNFGIPVSQRLFVQIALAVFGICLLTVSSKFKVPFFPVPMTLQTLIVLMIGALYSPRLAASTLIGYLGVGALGFPVFAGTPEKGLGLLYMAGPTGGYLAGYFVAAMIVSFAVARGAAKSFFTLWGVMLVAEVILFALGFSWLAYLFDVQKALAWGVTPFILGDLCKLTLAALIGYGAHRALFKTV